MKVSPWGSENSQENGLVVLNASNQADSSCKINVKKKIVFVVVCLFACFLLFFVVVVPVVVLVWFVCLFVVLKKRMHYVSKRVREPCFPESSGY